MSKLKLKDLINESVLGELPSAKMFKYNKETGKFDAPGSHGINEAETDDPSKDHEYDIIQAIIDFENRLVEEYGEQAGMELDKISKRFISDLQKLVKKYR